MKRPNPKYAQPEEEPDSSKNPGGLPGSEESQKPEETPDWLRPRKVECLSARLPSIQVTGMICRGDKVMIQGGSKSRKTWLNLQLAYSIANGLEFLGFKTYKTKCLAVDLELREGFLRQRLEKIREVLGEGDFGFLEVIPLRGYAGDLSMLRLAQLSAIIKGGDFGFFTIDPIYKLFHGKDENSNTEVATLLAPFDKITMEADATFNCTHHFAKGNAAYKEAIDRGAGAGAFQRNPDVIITMTPHKEKGCHTIEIIQRNFPEIEPFAVRWNGCLFSRAEELDPEELKEPRKAGRPMSQNHEIALAALRAAESNGGLTFNDWIEASRIPRSSLNRVRKQLIAQKHVFLSIDGHYQLTSAYLQETRAFPKNGEADGSGL